MFCAPVSIMNTECFVLDWERSLSSLLVLFVLLASLWIMFVFRFLIFFSWFLLFDVFEWFYYFRGRFDLCCSFGFREKEKNLELCCDDFWFNLEDLKNVVTNFQSMGLFAFRFVSIPRLESLVLWTWPENTNFYYWYRNHHNNYTLWCLFVVLMFASF